MENDKELEKITRAFFLDEDTLERFDIDNEKKEDILNDVLVKNESKTTGDYYDDYIVQRNNNVKRITEIIKKGKNAKFVNRNETNEELMKRCEDFKVANIKLEIKLTLKNRTNMFWQRVFKRAYEIN